MKNPNKPAEKAAPDGITMQIVTSLLCIVIGFTLLFFPSFSILSLCYCFCAALIIIGITLIVSYFIKNAYKKLNDYRFAFGVLFVILGCVELLRADILASEIIFLIGLVTLILSVIILQSVVQMKILKSGAWIVQLIFTVISLAGSLMVLLEFKPVFEKVEHFAYIDMAVTGILCLISLVIEAIVLKIVTSKEESEVIAEDTKKPADAIEDKTDIPENDTQVNDSDDDPDKDKEGETTV